MSSQNKKFVVWALQETAHEWIDWRSMGSADTIEEAQKIGTLCGWKYWRIRLGSEVDPSYVSGSYDDGKWME
jgi:hypothetical protein